MALDIKFNSYVKMSTNIAFLQLGLSTIYY